MLVLTRRPHEKVFLTMPDGTLIKVSLVEIDRTKARIGFEANLDVLIDREEVYRFKVTNGQYTPEKKCESIGPNGERCELVSGHRGDHKSPVVW